MQDAPQRRRPLTVIAGSGYVGERLAHARPCLCITRTRARAAELRARGLESAAWDFDSGVPDAALSAQLAGAGIVYLAPPPDRGTADPRLAGFLAALGELRPAVLVYISTTGVYGDAGGGAVYEQTPPAPRTDRAKRRLYAEGRVREWCTARGVRWVILRVPGIYGPGRLQLERLRRGEPVVRLEEAGPGNRIHVDDLAAACGGALDHEVGGVFNVGDGDHASGTEFLLTLARLSGLPPPPQITFAEARTRLSPGMLSFLEESRRVDTRAMRSVLGVVPRHATHESGLRAALAEEAAGAPEGTLS
jgi:nucleoside-diphosphate-sugar epimerase